VFDFATYLFVRLFFEKHKVKYVWINIDFSLSQVRSFSISSYLRVISRVHVKDNPNSKLFPKIWTFHLIIYQRFLWKRFDLQLVAMDTGRETTIIVCPMMK